MRAVPVVIGWIIGMVDHVGPMGAVGGICPQIGSQILMRQSSARVRDSDDDVRRRGANGPGFRPLDVHPGCASVLTGDVETPQVREQGVVWRNLKCAANEVRLRVFNQAALAVIIESLSYCDCGGKANYGEPIRIGADYLSALRTACGELVLADRRLPLHDDPVGAVRPTRGGQCSVPPGYVAARVSGSERRPGGVGDGWVRVG